MWPGVHYNISELRVIFDLSGDIYGIMYGYMPAYILELSMKLRICIGLLFILMGLVSVYYSVIIWNVHSGSKFYVVWVFIGIFLALFGVGIWAQWFVRIPMWLKLTVAGIVAAGAVICLIILVNILGEFHRIPEKNLDYVIVLGAQVKPEGPSVVLGYRLEAAEEYLRDNPSTVAIVSGAQGFNEPVSEADAMKTYLVARGIDGARILPENRATDTRENLAYSFEIVRELNGGTLDGARIGIVTSNFHMYRSLFLAKRLGCEDAAAVPARSLRRYAPNNIFREILAFLKDFIVK